MMSKLVSLGELSARIGDGAVLSLGGSFGDRFPGAVTRELVRRRVRDLELVKPSPGYDLDLLARAGAVRKARVGIAAMDEQLGALPYYRAAVESGEIELEEHSSATLVAALRATATGVPFMPVAGLDGSDMPGLNGWHRLRDPYGGGAPYVVPAIRPEFAVIHVNEVDRAGNVRVYGSFHWDQAIGRAAERVLVTAERLVEAPEPRRFPELTILPDFMVEAVAVVPRGAWPGSTHPDHCVDAAAMRQYLAPGEQALRGHLDSAPEVNEGAHA